MPGPSRRFSARFITLAIGLWLFINPLAAQHLEIRFFNVGQGDAALIREGGKTALIDAGGGAQVVTYLRELRIDTLDLVVASHNHADHIGGMTGVFGSTVVRYYLDNGVPHTTATYQRTIQAVRASRAQYLSATNRTITLGAARLHVIAPPAGRDHNNSSVGIIVEYGHFRALFTGDSELDELSYWLGTGEISRVHVVKVAHHGSWNGTSSDWVAATKPQVAVISVGAMNSYGHPSPQVVALWQGAGARVYRTDLDGGVLILANEDGSFVVTTDKSEPGGVVQIRPFVQDTTGAPVATPARVSPACCRVCSRGKACGNSCINRAYQCRQPPGCACDAKP
ncbi:MAG: MBL fold metallo-hydrolase [Gemmatimonadales bacterium]